MEMEFSWPYLIIALGIVGFIGDMGFRYKRESATISHNQSIERKKIDVIKQQADIAQSEIGKLKSEIEDMKEEKNQLTRDIKFCKEKLTELEARDRRRGTNRLEEE